MSILGFRYFFLVGRHEDTVDKNNEHHQQTEERGSRVKVRNAEHNDIQTFKILQHFKHWFPVSWRANL